MDYNHFNPDLLSVSYGSNDIYDSKSLIYLWTYKNTKYPERILKL